MSELIDRQAVIEKFAMTAPQMSVIRIYEAVEILESMPTIQPEPQEGRWIEKDGFDGDTYYDCSVCGNSWTTIDGTPMDNGMNYCPNCGAKMTISTK